jgi:hypothetical protein
LLCIIKYFLIALVGQILFLSVTVPIKLFGGLGETILYIFYMVPSILLFANNSAEKKEISIIILTVIPLVFYSIVISLGICLFSKLKNNSNNKLS